MISALRAVRASGACFSLGLLLAACGASNGGDAFGNLLAFNSLKAPPLPVSANKVINVDCPVVNVDDNGATVRVYAGADHSNDAVKYQLDIAQFARECQVLNGQLQIKVGVQGRLLIGPAGANGSFVAPIRFAIQRGSDKQVVAQQVVRTDVAMPQGSGEATFETISEPLVVPFTGQQADQDYTVTVGFEQAAPPAAPGKKPAHGRRRG